MNQSEGFQRLSLSRFGLGIQDIPCGKFWLTRLSPRGVMPINEGANRPLNPSVTPPSVALGFLFFRICWNSLQTALTAPYNNEGHNSGRFEFKTYYF
jgi:hypothetical protein